MNWARESCRAIREGDVFQKCHSRVDPEQFYEMCLQVGKDLELVSELNSSLLQSRHEP